MTISMMSNNLINNQGQITDPENDLELYAYFLDAIVFSRDSAILRVGFE